jgi:predicted RNase H-like nuclease (RuvC/YqgF family)
MDMEKEINDLKAENKRLVRAIEIVHEQIEKLRRDCDTTEKQLKDEISKRK